MSEDLILLTYLMFGNGGMWLCSSEIYGLKKSPIFVNSTSGEHAPNRQTYQLRRSVQIQLQAAMSVCSALPTGC